LTGRDSQFGSGFSTTPHDDTKGFNMFHAYNSTKSRDERQEISIPEVYSDDHRQRIIEPMKTNTWVSETLKLMRERNMTQERMADRLGITLGAFNHWMTERRKPRYENIEQIAKILGVPVTQLTAPNASLPTAEETKMLTDLRNLSAENQLLIEAMIRSLAKKYDK